MTRHQRTQTCKPCVKPIENETTPSESHTVDTENLYEPVIMVSDVEHTGCQEQLVLQLSWGMYKQDGALLEMNGYFVEPTDLYIYIYIYTYTHTYIYIYIHTHIHTYVYQSKSKW